MPNNMRKAPDVDLYASNGGEFHMIDESINYATNQRIQNMTSTHSVPPENQSVERGVLDK